MLDHPVVKAIGVLSAGVGLMTGIGTVVAWFESESLGESLIGAIRVAGLGYMSLGSAVAVVALAVAHRVHWGLRVLGVPFAAFGLGSVLYWGVWKGEDFWFFFAWGCLAIVIAVAATGYWIHSTIRSYRESHMTCPDCAERVKSEARVCRYCGYRFKRA